MRSLAVSALARPRRLMGAETKTLDAVASGARTVDFRLDPQVQTPLSIEQLLATR